MHYLNYKTLCLAPFTALIFLVVINTSNANSFEQTTESPSFSQQNATSLSQTLSNEDSSAISIAPEEEVDFLPVDDAYQLTGHIKDGSLIFDWVIADQYFLYGEQFNVSINGETLNSMREPGIIQYDPIFEKDVEKYFLFASLTVDSKDLPNQPYEVAVTSQGCANAGLCYPPHTVNFSVDGNAVTRTTPTASFDASPENNQPLRSSSSATTIAFMLISALIGGMILNLMPCVLPVLSLKALSLANSQGNHHRQGWAYTLGCVTTFIAIAAVLLAIRSAGEAVGWGFQLQSPIFVTLLAFLFFIMGLSLSGFFSLSGRWVGVGQSLTQGEGTKQSYFTGILAAVVASPCTAPFMATALGFALTQPWYIAGGVFAALGAGMALPLLALSYLPQLERWLPKPGAWMETFKQALAYPLYLTSIWLLWVLGHQQGSDALALVCIGAVLIVFWIWLGDRLPKLKWITAILVLITVGAFAWLNGNTENRQSLSSTNSLWSKYSSKELASLRNSGTPVFVNMTADWCITCIANEKVVLTESNLKKLKERGITLLKGDWTNYNPEITQLLEKHKRAGVPLYLYYPPNQEAVLLPQILTMNKLKQGLSLDEL